MENIKRLFSVQRIVWIILIAFLLISGCSGSEETVDDDYTADSGNTNAGESVSQGKRTSPRFNVQADTLTIHSRRKGGKGNSSIGVRSTAGKKYYSVQIGAYRLKSNADRNYELCLNRFKQPVIRFYAPGIKMERLCVGNFPTAKAAKAFAETIKEQYPKEYQNVWVTVLRHE